jgi:UDP-3-O-[3-hydroxymyristoyl] N-acetylglucosamine deacetylase
MELQHTIRKAVACRGMGLHTGIPVAMTLSPAPPDHGIVFRILPAGVDVRVRPDSLLNGHYATTIGIGGTGGGPGVVQIQTVEHLLAALRALGIDNVLVEMNAAEVPAMDGSAAPFVSLLYAAGREGQPAARRPLWVTDTIRVGDEGRWIQISPAPEFRISYTLDVDHPMVGVQVVSIAPTEERFVEEVASARTYGFLKDVDLLRQQGLALGGSPDNAVILGEERVLNGALRFRDEFVRHKILDVIGDLTLVGRPVVGHVVARNAGHALNHLLVREIAQRARRPHDGVVRAVSHAVTRSEGEARQASGVAAT